MQRSVTTYFLEMTDPGELRPSARDHSPLSVQRAEIPSPELSRFLYTAVGGQWYWMNRLPWTYRQWREHVARPDVATWIGYVAGTPAGYFELEQQGASVEIKCFGLLPQFIGQGLGGALLMAAIRRAWEREPQRVWLHTCTLDGPAALHNYRARGFKLYAEESGDEDVPDVAPGPWPGAHVEESDGNAGSKRAYVEEP